MLLKPPLIFSSEGKHFTTIAVNYDIIWRKRYLMSNLSQKLNKIKFVGTKNRLKNRKGELCSSKMNTFIVLKQDLLLELIREIEITLLWLKFISIFIYMKAEIFKNMLRWYSDIYMPRWCFQLLAQLMFFYRVWLSSLVRAPDICRDLSL